VRPLIAIDWGTTSLRGARLGPDGAALEERASTRGILSVPAGGHAEVFDELCGDWMAASGARALIAGMAGSRQGWIEAPYCPCPAAPVDLAARVTWVDPGRIAIVPGLSCEHDGAPDVMRGEETQVLGALRLLGLDAATCVLPGTHSKWVRIDGGRIIDFATAMTGEVYGLLRRHSILARTLPADDDELHADSFDAGVAHARRSGGLLQAAFAVRTLALFERLPLAQQPSYLSGIVIGEELRARAPAPGTGRVVLIGAAALTQRYRRALVAFGVDADVLDERATWRGLREIAEGLSP
jgi:2-dehydro-3-deoxygalactonokinase